MVYASTPAMPKRKFRLMHLLWS